MQQVATSKAQRAASLSALDRLVEATAADMDAVNALILSRAQSHVELIPALARYLIDAGGKRLRPMLTVAAAQMFNRPSGAEVKFAAAIEFMHNATLLHDDVVDESDMRRGQPAARMVWGNQASVLVGDFLLGQAFLMMVETGDLSALGQLAKAAAVIAEGEVFQLAKAGDLDATADEYRQVIRAKTATLFEAATEVGSMAGGASPAEQKVMARFGLELGLAFQLVDDVLDYGGARGALGKNTGDDLREGKMTLPVILALRAATSEERAVLTAALGNAKSGAEDLERILAIFSRYGTLRQSLAEAEAHADAAKAALHALSPSPMRRLLEDIAEFCVARAY